LYATATNAIIFLNDWRCHHPKPTRALLIGWSCHLPLPNTRHNRVDTDSSGTWNTYWLSNKDPRNFAKRDDVRSRENIFRFSGTKVSLSVLVIDEKGDQHDDENLVYDSVHRGVGGVILYRFFLFDSSGDCRIASIHSFVTTTFGPSSITWS
jgi:hypothetical protein